MKYLYTFSIYSHFGKKLHYYPLANLECPFFSKSHNASTQCCKSTREFGTQTILLGNDIEGMADRIKFHGKTRKKINITRHVLAVKGYYISRVIIDFNECAIRKPSLPFLHWRTWPSYKSNNTVKAHIATSYREIFTYISRILCNYFKTYVCCIFQSLCRRKRCLHKKHNRENLPRILQRNHGRSRGENVPMMMKIRLAMANKIPTRECTGERRY